MEPLLQRQRRFRRCLQDRQQSAFVFMLTLECLPILETGRAAANLAEVNIPVAGAVVNRVLLDTAGEGDFLRTGREREQRLLGEIDRELGELPRITLPLLPDDIQGLAGLRAFARHLS